MINSVARGSGKLVPGLLILCCLTALILTAGCSPDRAVERKLLSPVRTVVDLDIGQKIELELTNGSAVSVELLNNGYECDSFRKAIRRAWVNVKINGEQAVLQSGNYNLPVSVGGVLVDCPVTGAYYDNSNQDRWGLDKDARLRFWPEEEPYIRPGTFFYPVKQRILANDTQMGNEPCYVNGCEIPGEEDVYYHSGLDFGGTEGLVEVCAATDGIVVSVGDTIFAGHRDGTPVMPRYDVIYLLDERGWYYRYSHLKSFEAWVVPGAKVEKGRRIGLLGKEGGSGGWSHLHFEIKARQPSGRWGTEDAYVYAWQAYIDQYNPDIIAVARPHQIANTGDKVVLDGAKSWHSGEEKMEYNWLFTDGTTASGTYVERTYETSGTYCEVLKVSDSRGNLDYDFAVVQVLDKEYTDRLPPIIHANYHPSLEVRAGQQVTFKARSFNTPKGGEVWDFDDGSPQDTTSSSPCYGSAEMAPEGLGSRQAMLHVQGYAQIYHTFEKPGNYLVRVQHTGEWGLKAVARLHVEVFYQDGP